MWQKNGGGRAREGKVSAEARNPTDKECGWVLWAKEGEDVMKSLRIKGTQKKTFWQKPFRMPVRGTGRVSAAERCGSFEIIVNPSATSTQGGRVPRRIVVVNLTSLITKDQKPVCELIYSFNARGTGRASVCVVVVVVVGKEGEREPAGTVYLAKESLIMIYYVKTDVTAYCGCTRESFCRSKETAGAIMIMHETTKQP